MTKKWWMSAVGYQIYIKSFFDANGDGIGDLKGIEEKLDYLHDLGVNLIWITPFYDSPMDDNGYDVRDYFKVAKEYGTIEDFKSMLKKAKSLGIHVILDFVLNHTSDEHTWFIESRKSKDNPYRDFYIWQKPRYENGIRKEPTNWGSFFGGSAWKYDENTDEYYMKIFSDKMPDLNWKNPKVIDAMIEVGKWWLDLGIDGFRIDAVSHLDKAEFVDSTYSKDIVLDWNKFSNLPKVHEYLKILNERLFKPYHAYTIGEVGGAASIEEAIKYASFDSNELSMVFNFDHNWCNNIHDIDDLKDLKVNVKALKDVFFRWQNTFKRIGWLPLNWLNHDQPRVVSHYGSLEYHKESAKMLANLLYLKRGTPFIYQGEEIGMTNYPFTKFKEFNDISTINQHKDKFNDPNVDEVKLAKKIGMTSRDNPRTMMQWSNKPYAGFSKVKPWFLVNPNYESINVESQIKDPNSILNYYRQLINLRRQSIYKDLIIFGNYEIIDYENEKVFTYKRSNENQILLSINSFSKETEYFDMTNYEIVNFVIHNYNNILVENNKIILRPFEALAIEVKEKK